MPQVWDPINNRFVEVEEGAGALSSFGAGMMSPAADLFSGIEQMLGNEERMQAIQQNQARREQAAGGQTNPGAVGLGNLAGEAVMGAGAAGGGAILGGLRGAVAAESMLQASRQGTIGERAVGAAIPAIGLAAVPVTQTIMRAAGGVSKSVEIPMAVKNILDAGKAEIDSVTSGLRARQIQHGLGGQRSAGAAQIGQRQRIETEQVLTGPEADDLGLPLSPAQRARVDAAEGDRLDEIEEALRLDETSERGRGVRTRQQEWLRDEVAREIDLAGPLNKSNVTQAIQRIGQNMNRLEEAAPFNGINPELVNDWVQIAADTDSPAVRRIANKMTNVDSRLKLKEVVQDVQTGIRQAEKGRQYTAAASLRELREDLRAELVNGMDPATAQAYQAERRKFAIAKTLQESENILKPGGNININSFIKAIAKRFKPFTTGEDMSPLSRALRTLETVQRREVKGSDTAFNLQNMGARVAGLF